MVHCRTEDGLLAPSICDWFAFPRRALHPLGVLAVTHPTPN